MFKLFYLAIFFSFISCVSTEKTELSFYDEEHPYISGNGRTPASEIDYELKLQVGDRRYVESVLSQVFDLSESESTSIRDLIYKKQEFGGACDRYAQSEINGTVEFPRETCSGLDIVLPATANPMRFAYMTKVCENLVNNSSYLSRAVGNVNQDFSETHFLSLYQKFYLEESPSTEVINSFKNLYDEKGTQREGWKLVMLGLCLSPAWQVL